MYELLVFYSDASSPAHRIIIERASDVLTAIPTLMEKHAGCERVEVLVAGRRLFSVDCHGNTTPG